MVIEMLKNGCSPQEITRSLGYANDTRVYDIARAHGLSVKWKQKQMFERDEAMRKFKAEGHTHKEVAEKFGVSVGITHKACKGIAPQAQPVEFHKKKAEEQHKKTLGNREAKAIKQIERLGFEYVGGYTNTDGYVSIKCPKCGTVFNRSMISIRHPSTQTITCPGCAELEREEKRKQEEYQKAQAERERIRKAEEKKKEAEEKEQAKWHKCPVCGEMTNRPKYCSKACSAKALNKTHEIRRDRKIKGVLVDKDITLQRLYERDRGVCYLCGEVCDWDDKEERDGTIICGNRYPSIDHVVPLSRGGEHSWQNVRLAHRICNTRKGAKHQKIASSLTISE